MHPLTPSARAMQVMQVVAVTGLAGFCSRRHSGGDALVVGRHRMRVYNHVLLLTSLAYGHGSGDVFEKTVLAASP